MKPGDGLTVARWLHAADGRPADDVAEWAWSELLEGIEVEDAIDVIVEHYRQSDEMLPACDLLSRATVHGFLRETRELELLAAKRDRKARPRDGVDPRPMPKAPMPAGLLDINDEPEEGA